MKKEGWVHKRFLKNARVIFVFSIKVLGAPASALGAPSISLACFSYVTDSEDCGRSCWEKGRNNAIVYWGFAFGTFFSPLILLTFILIIVLKMSFIFLF